jgi:hypothetical protein
LKNFTTEQVIDTLAGLGFAGKREDIERSFHGYHNRKFNLTLPDLLAVKDHSLDAINLEQNSMLDEKQNAMLDEKQEKPLLISH